MAYLSDLHNMIEELDGDVWLALQEAHYRLTDLAVVKRAVGEEVLAEHEEAVRQYWRQVQQIKKSWGDHGEADILEERQAD